MKKNFLELFENKKPIFAMIHLKGDSDAEIFDRAKKEIEIYRHGNVDAIIVENYYGTYDHMKLVLDYLMKA
ncbi:MAG: membrane biogenesis protein, partial [Erysipelotrichaceae bacterium]